MLCRSLIAIELKNECEVVNCLEGRGCLDKNLVLILGIAEYILQEVLIDTSNLEVTLVATLAIGNIIILVVGTENTL